MSIRTGDVVLHKPSGETWLVAYVQDAYLAWCGWPEGEAQLADCELVSACTDEQHWEWVRRIAAGRAGRRSRWAQWYLQGHSAAPEEVLG